MNFEEYVKNIDIDKISVGKSDICFVLYFDTEKIDPEKLGQLHEFACKKLPLPVVAFPKNNKLQVLDLQTLIHLRDRINEQIGIKEKLRKCIEKAKTISKEH